MASRKEFEPNHAEGYDVIVAGAGPVGLTLAIDLGAASDVC